MNYTIKSRLASNSLDNNIKELSDPKPPITIYHFQPPSNPNPIVSTLIQPPYFRFGLHLGCLPVDTAHISC